MIDLSAIRSRWRSLISALGFIVCGVVALAAPSEWPAFRGMNGSGVTETDALPVEFGPKLNVIWSTLVPSGTSSPVVTTDHVFLTGADKSRLLTIGVARKNGTVLWQREVSPNRSEALHKLNSPASPTPAADSGNVYVFFADFGLISYSGDGRERWRLPLGPFSNLHGMAASPIVVENKVIQLCDQDSGSYLLAVDKDSGKVIWKTERPEVVHGFATPTLFRTGSGRQQIIVPGSYQLAAYSVETGEKLWWVRGLTWQVKTTAVVSHDTIYATGWAPGADAGERLELPEFAEVLKEGDKNGDGRLSPEEVPVRWKHGGSWNAIDLERDGVLDGRDWSFYRARRSSHNVSMAVRPGDARGDLTDSHRIWQVDRSVPQVPSPLLYQGVLYTLKDGGILTSSDPANGQIQKQARLPNAIDSYYSSPVAGDGKIFLVSETGKVSVVKPGSQWEPLALNDLGEACYATPAIADGRLFIRTSLTLYCFGKPLRD